MSIAERSGVGQNELQESSVEELYRALGEGDTPELFAGAFKLDFDHDIPAGGGNSLDARTVYIDRGLYAEVMDGEFKETGLSPQQIIDRWIDHEHTELAIILGDNPISVYRPAHQRALRREHEGVLAIVGRSDASAKIAKYEDTIWPGLVRAYNRNPKKPPLDLWCGPYVNQPTHRDLEIIAVLKRHGVVDAAKRSKYEMRFGVGEHHCRDCAHWKPDRLSRSGRTLALCEEVSGLVRDELSCYLWKAKDD
jgi:hypothetical protein